MPESPNKLLDIIRRETSPEPWNEADNIPWHDPDFSARMLKEHLSQEHDLASRRFDIIDKHTAWIHNYLLDCIPTKVLDLACGPGFYSHRLAALGHRCRGIDYSPASIAYAKKSATNEDLNCTFVHEDLRIANYGGGYGLAMMIYGEFNVFKPSDAKSILKKSYEALSTGGLLLIEAQTASAVRCEGEQGTSWYSEEQGLFSDLPHLVLKETFWNNEQQVATVRYYIIDAKTNRVDQYGKSTKAYSNEELNELLENQGFKDVKFYPSMSASGKDDNLVVVVATK